MTTIYFVRHGKYKNPNDVIPFRQPGYRLSEEGILQMKNAGEYFKDKEIKALFCSPIQRTMESAEIIGSEIGLQPVSIDLLIEVNSPLMGINKDKYNKLVKNDIYTYPEHVLSGGESIDDIYNRMKAFTNMILKDFKDSNVIAVSHGDPIMIFTRKQEGLKLRNNGSILKANNYIPMGGCIKMLYDENGSVIEAESLNF